MSWTTFTTKPTSVKSVLILLFGIIDTESWIKAAYAQGLSPSAYAVFLLPLGMLSCRVYKPFQNEYPSSSGGCFTVVSARQTLWFSNKASLHRKQGFFTLQTRLLFIQKKPCLQTHHNAVTTQRHNRLITNTLPQTGNHTPATPFPTHEKPESTATAGSRNTLAEERKLTVTSHWTTHFYPTEHKKSAKVLSVRNEICKFVGIKVKQKLRIQVLHTGGKPS